MSNDVDVTEVWAVFPDGTRVPLTDLPVEGCMKEGVDIVYQARISGPIDEETLSKIIPRFMLETPSIEGWEYTGKYSKKKICKELEKYERDK